MHRDKAKNRVTQQSRDFQQTFFKVNVKRFRSIFRIQRQNQVFRDVYAILLSDQ